MEETKNQFITAFEEHSDELFRHALLRLSDRERALDLTQECFLRAWRHVAGGGEVRQYRAFLYKILNNLIVDEYRKHTTQSLDALLEREETHDVVEGELLREGTDALEEAMTRYDSARTLVALEDLSPAHRAVLVLRYVDGLSIGEISECTGESENAISVRIHRALHKLRTLLDPTV